MPLLLPGRPAAAFLLLTLVVVDDDGPIPRFDRWVSGGAHALALAHPLWRASMATVTMGGSTAVVGPLVALGCLVLLGVGRWRTAVLAAAAMIVTLVLRLALVTVIARPRPADQLAPAGNFSFPSGHTAASGAAALILVIVCWPLLRQRWSRILLTVVAGGWALTVGVSRVALVVHWPSDVVGAWLLVMVTVPGVGLLARRGLGVETDRAEEEQ